MVYDLSNPGRGVIDCPRCRHMMERLRSRLAVSRNEGYLLDYSRDSDDAMTFVLHGWLGLALRTLYRCTLQPLTSKVFGHLKEQRLRRVLKAFPESLICPYCNHIVKRK
jgi:hypothetical protein